MFGDVGQVPLALLALADDALQRIVVVGEVVVARVDLTPRGEPVLFGAVGVSEVQVGGLAAGLLEVPAGFLRLDEQGLLGLFGGVTVLAGALKFPLGALQAQPGLVQAGLGLRSLHGAAAVPLRGEFAHGTLHPGVDR